MKSNNFSTILQLLKILKSEQKLTFLISQRQALGCWTKVWGKLTWDEERNMQGGEGLRDWILLLCHCCGTREEPRRQWSSCCNGFLPGSMDPLSFSCWYPPSSGWQGSAHGTFPEQFYWLKHCLLCLSHSWLEQFSREIVLWMHQDHMEQFPYSHSISGTTPAIVQGNFILGDV